MTGSWIKEAMEAKRILDAEHPTSDPVGFTLPESPDIVARIRNRIHDSHMSIERLLDECADEIEQLRWQIEGLEIQVHTLSEHRE